MQRLLDVDPDELRGKYLGDFAYLFKTLARQVDALRYVDFVQYIIWIDAYRAEKKRQQEKEDREMSARR